MASLANLTSLDLSYCEQVLNVGPLASLAKLTSLDLTGCWAKSFARLDRLPSLQKLLVHGSRFSDLHPAVCGAGEDVNALESVRQYYAALSPDAKPDAEIKLFILGNGRAGKSYLVQRLTTDKTFELIERENIRSTHGVQIASFPAPAAWGLPHPVRLCVWDFGGQDVNYGTHALFLREPAVYLLLYSKATENKNPCPEGGFEMQNRRLPYWFNYLRQEAGSDGVVNSPVLWIQSQCNKDGELSEPKSRPPADEFPQLSPIIHTSAKNDDGLDLLVPRLKRAIKDLLREHPQPSLPKSWDDVRLAVRELQKVGTPVTLTHDEFAELCEQHGCGNNAEVLREALHLMGVVFYRRGLFGDCVIVNQAWVLDKIYTIFDRTKEPFRQLLRRQSGRFTRDDLSQFFWSRHSPDDQKLFLSFMQQCGICFRATGDEDKDTAEYIAPDMLEPWGKLSIQPTLELAANAMGIGVRAKYALLHDGITRNFLSHIGEVARDIPMYWKYGCHFRDATTQSDVLIRTDGNAIRMQAWGDRPKQLLQNLLKLLARVPSGQPPTMTWDDEADEPIALETSRERDRLPIFSPILQRKVFISYSHEPRSTAFVRGLVPALRAARWEPIWDEEQLHQGDDISQFCDRVRSTPFLLPLLAESYLKKLWCLTEFFSFYEEQGCQVHRFAERSSVAADIGQIDSNDHLSDRVVQCHDFFTSYVQQKRGLSTTKRELIDRIIRWSRENETRVAPPFANLLETFTTTLTTFGLDALAANRYTAAITSLNRKFDEFHAARRQ